MNATATSLNPSYVPTTAEVRPPERRAPLELVDELLRQPGTFLLRTESPEELAPLARVLLITALVGFAIFGASIGAFRMGLQPLYAGLKLPLISLLTAALAVPTMTGLSRALGASADVRQDLALVLASLTLTSLVLAALAPLVLLMVMLEVGYHQMVLTTVGCCGLAGAWGLAFFLRGLSRRSGGHTSLLALVSLVVFGLVGTQMAWTFRPFVTRPRAEVELVRSIEGSFLDSVAGTFDSARGIYHRSAAPIPGEP